MKSAEYEINFARLIEHYDIFKLVNFAKKLSKDL